MARLNERRDLTYNVLGQVEFMLAKAQATEGYRATYDKPLDADGILMADWARLVSLVKSLGNLGATPLLADSGMALIEEIDRNKPRTRGTAIMGGQIVCKGCGCADAFIEAPRSTDYFNFQCTRCGTNGSSLTETGASR